MGVKMAKPKRRKKDILNLHFPEISDTLNENSELLSQVKDESSPLYWMNQLKMNLENYIKKESDRTRIFDTTDYINRFLQKYENQLEQVYTAMNTSDQQKQTMINGFRVLLLESIADYLTERLNDISQASKNVRQIFLSSLKEKFEGTLDTIMKYDISEKSPQ